MPAVEPVTALPVLACLDGGMADTQRLATYLVARRIQLGYRHRPAFAEAAGVSLRTLSDIENGLRVPSASTIAALDQALQWQPGSVRETLAGGEPAQAKLASEPGDHSTGSDPLLIQVMRSTDISDEDKARIVEILIAEKRRAEDARAAHAQQLIDLARRPD
ncbi:helix-turn-helix domain-containing protein [Actinoplanes sp. NPDC051494]|uniref:helix-turn-helix domain-containing protein n=1 Tax=Actinoplanes sp. NPDC051494 TaxID=3363907 RepID=UPI0037B34F1A